MTTLTVQSNELPISNEESFKSELKEKKKSIQYNIELLCDIIERDDCGIDIFLYENASNKDMISFICNCGNYGNKTFRNLFNNGGGYCKKCAKINKDKKKIKTNIEKFGFKYPMQSTTIKEKMKKTNLERLGVEHPMQSEIVKEKYKQTNLEKLGVEYPMQSEIVKEKSKKTNTKKIGVEYPMQSEIVKEKTKETNIEKRGVEYSFQCVLVKEKTKETNLERLGVENPFQSEMIKEKIKETCLEKYNVEYAMQNSKIAEKSLKNSYKIKEYKMPSGNIIFIQGYENYALDELLKENIKEDDIVTSRLSVPEIWYLDRNNKQHKYYTDIYIRSQNKCIEVKSEYTSQINKDIIKLKEDATIGLGYKYEMRIYDNKGNRI